MTKPETLFGKPVKYVNELHPMDYSFLHLSTDVLESYEPKKLRSIQAKLMVFNNKLQTLGNKYGSLGERDYEDKDLALLQIDRIEKIVKSRTK